MKTLPRIKSPLAIAVGGLLSLTMGATPVYAETSTNAIVVKPVPTGEVTDELKIKDSSEITEADVNARTEQYEEVDAKGMLTELTKHDVNDLKFFKDNSLTTLSTNSCFFSVVVAIPFTR